MEEVPKLDISLVVGQTIGEIRAVHLRLDRLEKEVVTVTDRLHNRPSRSERYLMIFSFILLTLLGAASFLLYRGWIGGKLML